MSCFKMAMGPDPRWEFHPLGDANRMFFVPAGALTAKIHPRRGKPRGGGAENVLCFPVPVPYQGPDNACARRCIGLQPSENELAQAQGNHI